MTSVSKSYDFVPGQTIESSQVDANFDDVVNYINGEVIVRDASKAFTAIPSGPGTDPTSPNQFARKQYVDNADNLRVKIDGSTAFTGIPSGPATNPSTANQFTRKQYVDDAVAAKVSLPNPVAPSLNITNPQIRVGNVVGTTDGVGEIGFPFASAFPTACIGVCITIGDVNAGGMVVGVKGLSAGGFTAAVWSPTVVASIGGGYGVVRQTNSSVRLNYIAFGY
jgi:hypothetical protein